ncbi:MAG: formate dehydrogenase accessory protein FdhE [Desulfovibrionaceae bacterium]|nr:formate dehydrogenase accessory protein FdhE [Desulfovibrionaceae bacterium]
MEQSCQTTAETLNDIIAWRPALASLLTAFSPLLTQAETLTAELLEDPLVAAINLPQCEPSRLQLGASLLSHYTMPDVSGALAYARTKLWPQLQAIPALTDSLEPYYSYLGQVTLEDQHKLLDAVLLNDGTLLSDLATSKNLDAGILHFLATFLYSSLLKAVVLKNYGPANLEKEWPWETNNIWQQGYCPVCGSLPTIAWLDKAVIDERNTYLLGGGGRKHLHCGLCGANWRFLRLACPVCGIAESKQIEILTCDEDSHGESLHWCAKCNSYLPTVDLRERIAIPNLDAQAFGMLHLELIAKEKQLKPLHLSFWNSFS